ncbi:Ribose-5-phosphate isomerase B [Limihaloglobus sulfuriphilus]|uniref:Ribose-5-phosphate isomerase B n=1 Tax=Limihaloglobus sulfuriphilus TaxID=1851148 RepID=A0A1Q2MGM7_9BACT|nr:ribose 5-phosphate isomerase B [Limihaloglobus sulfuriphilus]AQQ71804.1 Ribose-5-phosphate isomerase B [Limihaloglobus sulfuriphilus]
MKIGFGNDHRGFETRKSIIGFIKQLGHQCIDFGSDSRNPVDYTDIAYAVSTSVAKKEIDMAVLVCSTGMGMCIAANKVKGIRATFCMDQMSAEISRHHNHSNVLCLSADLEDENLMHKIIETWLKTKTGGGRHKRRVDKIREIEECHDPRELK